MSTLARRVATIVSWAGHPLVFVTISVGIVLATQLASRRAIGLIGALFLAVIAPTGVLLFLGVRSGRWRDADSGLAIDAVSTMPGGAKIDGAAGFHEYMLGRSDQFAWRRLDRLLGWQLGPRIKGIVAVVPRHGADNYVFALPVGRNRVE